MKKDQQFLNHKPTSILNSLTMSEANCLTSDVNPVSGGMSENNELKTKDNNKKEIIRTHSTSEITNYENKRNIDNLIPEELTKQDETNLITEEMIQQEKILEEKILNEENEIRKKMLEAAEIQKEQGFKRLQHLLNRSSIYAKYLAEKLQIQEVEFVKQKEKENQKNERLFSKHQEQNDIRVSQRIIPRVKDLKQNPVPLQSSKRKHENVPSSGEVEVNARIKKQKHHNTLHIKDFFTKEDLEKKSNENVSLPQEHPNICTDDDVSERQPELFSGGVMRGYQIEGYEWLKILYENGVNGILADEMGLGKTIQCIALISHLVHMGVPGPFFVCAPLSTLSNWFSEFKRFAPKVPVLLYHGSKSERLDLVGKIKKKEYFNGKSLQPVVITSYQIAIIDRPKLANIEWKYLIIDEAHRIKNFQCRLVCELKLYNSLNRLLLTGTPLQNNLAELWSLLNFILPEIFDDLRVFQSWFDISQLSKSEAAQEIVAQEQEKQIVSSIHQILTPFLLRRTKADVVLKLPPKKEVIVYAPLTLLQQKYYNAILSRTIEDVISEQERENTKVEVLDSKRLRKEISYKEVSDKYFFDNIEKEAEEASHSLSTISQSNKLEAIYKSEIKMRNILMMLRKVLAHPYLLSYRIDSVTKDYIIDENMIKDCGKLLVLDAMLPELRKRGHKILIFSQFVMMLDMLAEYCEFRNYPYHRLDGTMKLADREVGIREFNEKESSFLFLISTRAGGLGINLAGADTVIIYDSDWNPQCDLQAQDRCHRIGQTKPVVVYRLVTRNTVDQKMVERASAKRKLEKMIIQNGRFNTNDTLTKSQKAITKEELLELLQSCDVQNIVDTKDQLFTPEELDAILDRSDMISEGSDF